MNACPHDSFARSFLLLALLCSVVAQEDLAAEKKRKTVLARGCFFFFLGSLELHWEFQAGQLLPPMDSQQVSNIQNAVLQKVQQGSSQSVGLLKFLHQKCTPAQLRSNEFLVFIVTTVLQATLHGRLDVLQTLLALGHTLDFPMTIKQTDGQPPQKMAPLEVLCYTQPHKLQQPKFRQVALFLFKNCKFEGYPEGTARNLAFVLQELQDFDEHKAFFEAIFAGGSNAAAGEVDEEGLSVLAEFDLGGGGEGSSDEKTQAFILNFESESIGVEPNYFAQLIAVREKWWARQRGSARSGSSAPGADIVHDRSEQHLLSRWNEKIAMKKIFAERVQDKKHLVPTLFSVYMDELTDDTSNDANGAVTSAVTSAVANAFESDPLLEQVHVKPSHMCRGLGITSICRKEFIAAQQEAVSGRAAASCIFIQLNGLPLSHNTILNTICTKKRTPFHFGPCQYKTVLLGQIRHGVGA